MATGWLPIDKPECIGNRLETLDAPIVRIGLHTFESLCGPCHRSMILQMTLPIKGTMSGVVRRYLYDPRMPRFQATVDPCISRLLRSPNAAGSLPAASNASTPVRCAARLGGHSEATRIGPTLTAIRAVNGEFFDRADSRTAATWRRLAYDLGGLAEAWLFA